MPSQVRDRIVAAIGDIYDIREELGRGGMALVFRAMDLRLRRQVAIKVLPPELAFNADVRTRFLREAQMAAQLNHPNIVPIYSVDERENISYIVMGLVDGEALGAAIHRDGRMPVEQARRILGEVADALDYAHRHGVIHRDVKPDNILLDRATGRAMVTDFGIARAAAEDSRLTVTGIAIGTPAYMSPEQALGEREVDGRSDIYSLAVVGYQMLVGEPPFKANNTPSMLMKHIAEQPRPIRERRPDAPEGLVNALHRALAKQPEERWADAAAFKAAIASGQAPPYSPAQQPAPQPQPAQKWWEVPPAPARAIAPPEAFPAAPLAPLGMGMGLRIETNFGRAREIHESAHRMQSEIRQRNRPRELDPADARAVQERIAKFRRQFFMTAGTLTFLAWINATTHSPPWIIFPFVGMSMALMKTWAPLGRLRLRMADVVLEGDDAPALRELRKERKSVRALAASFRERVKLAFGFGGLSTAIYAIGASANYDPLIGPFMVAAALAGGYTIGAAMSAARLMKRDVPLGEAISGGALTDESLPSEPAKVAPPLGDLARADARRHVSSEVLEGARGAIVVRACEDRLAILRVVETLDPDDRALIPDVAPTADSLVERIASLAQTVHRLDADATSENLARLDARINELKKPDGTVPAERERHRALLDRQRATVSDLVQRRDQLVSQLEHASIVLSNLRLDLVKLRSSGIGSALEDVASATQEARAVSRDIGHVLHAANEIRSI